MRRVLAVSVSRIAFAECRAHIASASRVQVISELLAERLRLVNGIWTTLRLCYGVQSL